MNPKRLIQAIGILAIVALSTIEATAGIDGQEFTFTLIALLLVVAPEALEKVPFGPFGGRK